MWINTDDWRCQEHVRHMRSPNCSCAQTSTSSALIASTSGSWSARAVAKQHLLQRVAAQSEPQRLERDHFFGRDVPEVHGRTELLDEPRLGRLGRCLETTFAGPTVMAVSAVSSVRHPPDESKIPAVPPSRASVITFHAPASSS